VIADLHPKGKLFLHEIRVEHGMFAGQKEGGFRMESAQEVQDSRCEPRVGTVVEREANDRLPGVYSADGRGRQEAAHRCRVHGLNDTKGELGTDDQGEECKSEAIPKWSPRLQSYSRV